MSTRAGGAVCTPRQALAPSAPVCRHEGRPPWRAPSREPFVFPRKSRNTEGRLCCLCTYFTVPIFSPRGKASELAVVFTERRVSLPALSAAESMLMQQVVLVVSTGDHMLSFYWPWLHEPACWMARRYSGDAGPRRVSGWPGSRLPIVVCRLHFVTWGTKRGW